MKKILRGEIYYAELDPVIGSEQGGTRPVLIIQSNRGTRNRPTSIVAPLTKLINKKYDLDTHVNLRPRHYLNYHSVVLLEQMRAISKDRLEQYIGKISKREQRKIDKAILNTFGLINKENKIYENKNIQCKSENDL